MLVQGKEIAEVIYKELETKFNYGKRLCFVQFGDNTASDVFIKMKMKIAERLKVRADIVHESTPISTEWALQILKDTIAKGYEGVILQLPVPEQLDAKLLLNTIPPALDIDLLSDEMIRRYDIGRTLRMPPVAYAVVQILMYYKVELENKKIVILGKGKLVGEPVMNYFKNKNIPFEAYDHTDEEAVRMKAIGEADIIITGVGKSHIIKPNMIKKGVVLIDAGTSEQAGKMTGDCDTDCVNVASLFSSVPGGVGPLTVAGIFANLAVEEANV